MAYYSTHSICQFLLNNKKQRVQFALAHPVEVLCKEGEFLEHSVFIVDTVVISDE